MKKTLFGYGTTTKALASVDIPWDIFDDSFTCKELDEYGNSLIPPSMFDKTQSSLEIPSPGFPPNHHLIKNSQNLISEYDYFFNDMPTSVWITGTNGKTTTTQMLQYLLEFAGSVEGGNIGKPLTLLDKNAPLWILETSSFTLHYTKTAYPNVYVILPIKPDHLSWHGNFEEYEKAKLKPLSMMKDGSVVILPKKYEDIDTKATLITYETSEDLANKFNIDLKALHVKEPFLLDALLALCVQKILFNKIDIEKINTFKIDRHKLEEFFDKYERLWVNDTKGTNIDATIEALKRYKDLSIHIVLGGDDKGVDLTRLFEEIEPLHVNIYAIGSNTNKLVALAKSISKPVHACYELKNAIPLIDKALGKKGVGLLSPAAASLDQYSSYIERGEEFIKLVKEL